MTLSLLMPVSHFNFDVNVFFDELRGAVGRMDAADVAMWASAKGTNIQRCDVAEGDIGR
jgi:hypothetical protein